MAEPSPSRATDLLLTLDTARTEYRRGVEEFHALMRDAVASDTCASPLALDSVTRFRAIVDRYHAAMDGYLAYLRRQDR